MHNLIIVGAGGFGRELAEMVWDVFSPSDYRLAGFLAQGQSRITADGLDLPVLGDPEQYQPSSSDRLVMAIGHMNVRRKVIEALEGRGGRFVSFVHPLARIAKTATIGEGAVIYPMAVVSNSSILEPHVHLNYYASVGHDCRVGRYCLLAPYATLNGFVDLDTEVYMSTHSTVAPGKKIGARSKVSANSACMHHAGPNMMVFGVPGRQVKRLD